MKELITSTLLERYLAGTCKPAEQELVERWYAMYEGELPLFLNEESEEALQIKEETKAAIRKIIKKELSIAAAPQNKHQVVDMIRTRKRWVFLVGAAAVVLILLVPTVYLFFKHPATQQVITTGNESHRAHNNAITPGSNKATLTLSDGSIIPLDSSVNGELVVQDNARVMKLKNGQLSYSAGGLAKSNHQPSLSYNTLSTPRGAQFQLILPDGSKVWLNAASSLRYPVAFVENERVVELSGEAYFEIAKITSAPVAEKGAAPKAIPFRVKVKDMEVEVLGTHFNVNAYTDEQTINTTLLEGSVKLHKQNKKVLIRPGEQAKLNAAGNFTVEPADVKEAIAWKMGLFQFDNVTIETVMRQVARWYNVDIEYTGNSSADRFRGKFYRNTDITQLLKILELSGAHFIIDNKKIIVE